MSYKVTRQLGTLYANYTMAKTEVTAPAPIVRFEENMNNFGGVKLHDDDFLSGDNSITGMPFYDGGAGFITKETIDLRDAFADGQVLDDITINIQRAFEIPRVYNLYNISPDAEIYETILITPSAYPSESDPTLTGGVGLTELNPNDWFLAGFRPRIIEDNVETEFRGISFPREVLLAQTRIYSRDPSRAFSGTLYASQSDDETTFPTTYYETFSVQDSVVRGFPDLVYSPQINIYRIVTVGYYQRTAILDPQTVQNQNAKCEFLMSPVHVTITGNMRKGTETEVIRESTNILLDQPVRPDQSR